MNLRPEGTVKVLMTPDAMESLVVRDHIGRRLSWDWGEPDPDGCYTPTISVALVDPTPQDMEDGRALRELREACERHEPYRAWFVAEWSYPRHLYGPEAVEVRFEKHVGDGRTRFRGPTVAAAADKAREALR